MATHPGMVHIVGGGPGDPELLTLKAVKRLGAADAVVYDRLVAPEVLAYAAPGAERFYVGKARGAHSVPQREINALLVRLAHEGKRVVRLKGGDPSIFGRGAEEAEALVAAGIAFELVPGVTAACGAAAYAGIPLTHRDHAQACVLVTGCLKDGTANLDWDMLARARQTVVVYMGLAWLEEVCAQLIAHGLPSATPAALVARATSPKQRVIQATLASLPRRVRRAAPEPPTLIVVGEVVRLRTKLGAARVRGRGALAFAAREALAET